MAKNFFNNVLHICCLGSVILMIVAVYRTPNIGFNHLAGCALTLAALTHWLTRGANKLQTRPSTIFKMALAAVATATGLASGGTGLLVSAEYAGLDSYTGVTPSAVAQHPVCLEIRSRSVIENLQVAQSYIAPNDAVRTPPPPLDYTLAFSYPALTIINARPSVADYLVSRPTV